MPESISRRTALRHLAAGSLAMAATNVAAPLIAAEKALPAGLKGRIKHSVCKWCYKDIPLETLCQAAEGIGLQSIELLKVADFATLQKYGLSCAIVDGVPGGIGKGLNRVENHDKIVAFMEETIPLTAKAGFPNIICFSGNRDGMSDEQGFGKLRRRPETHRASGGETRRDRLHGAPEQPHQPQGLHGRPHAVGRVNGEAGRVRTRQTSLRYLSHADHGG
jgi:hypothetical protein